MTYGSSKNSFFSEPITALTSDMLLDPKSFRMAMVPRSLETKMPKNTENPLPQDFLE